MRQKRPHKGAISAPAFQVYPADELADTRYQMMNNQQRGCYMTLWLHAWRSFAIPKLISRIARLCGETPEEMEKIWPEISEYFEDHPTDDKLLVHPGLEKERTKQAKFKAARALAGRKGGTAKARNLAEGNGPSKGGSKPLAKGVAKPSFSSSSSSSSSESLSPKPPQGEERESDAIQEPEERILLRGQIAAIFKRPASRAWSKSELEAFETLGEITPQEIALIRRFYTANIEAKKDRRRHNLETLLRNWGGELDKANGYFAAQQRKDYAL